MSDDASQKYQLASDFDPAEGEANFPPPLAHQEVVGGTHIAPECIVEYQGQLVMALWPGGLPRHEQHRVARFPHGLMRFGERIDQCAARLLDQQFGLTLETVEVLEIDSYVDDKNHWHLEPLLYVRAGGRPSPPEGVESLVYFLGPDLPPDAIWSDDWQRVYSTFVAERLPAHEAH